MSAPRLTVKSLGLEITKVDWAEPESEIDDAVMAKVS